MVKGYNSLLFHLKTELLLQRIVTSDKILAKHTNIKHWNHWIIKRHLSQPILKVYLYIYKE